MICAENITKIYTECQNSNKVLDNLCFKAEKGQFCMITGKSGCGKSTLLNVLSCLDSFDSGKLIIGGKDIAFMSPKQIYNMRRFSTGFIFQGYNLISSLTAMENVCLPLKYQKIKRAQRNIMAQNCLDEVGILDRKDYLPFQMSGGQQQRVAIARALVTEPSILFCDEPTGNLDSESALVILQKLKELKEKGTLIIMITHDKSLLPKADRCLVLENGRLIEK